MTLQALSLLLTGHTAHEKRTQPHEVTAPRRLFVEESNPDLVNSPRSWAFPLQRVPICALYIAFTALLGAAHPSALPTPTSRILLPHGATLEPLLSVM